MAFPSFTLKVAVAAGVLATTAAAQTLPLPDNLINLDSAQGSVLLQESEALQSYWSLTIQFVTQKNQAFCGVASIVMVLNALQVPAPTTPEFDPYRTFTQENLFTPATEMVLPQATLRRIGMTLDQIGAFLATYSVKTEVRHASDSSVEEFRELAKRYLSAPDHHVIVNYLRMSMGQEKGGHISPLAAYDADTDRFLILDVARYKYPPVWVSAAELFAAMNTTDSDNQNRTRGFVLVSKLHSQCLILHQSVRLYELCRAGYWKEAMQLQRSLWRINELFARFNLAAGIKAGLQLQGYAGNPIPPQAPLNSQERRTIGFGRGWVLQPCFGLAPGRGEAPARKGAGGKRIPLHLSWPRRWLKNRLDLQYVIFPKWTRFGMGGTHVGRHRDHDPGARQLESTVASDRDRLPDGGFASLQASRLDFGNPAAAGHDGRHVAKFAEHSI